MIPELNGREQVVASLLGGLVLGAGGTIHYLALLAAEQTGPEDFTIGEALYVLGGPPLLGAVVVYLLLRFGLVLPLVITVLYTLAAIQAYLGLRGGSTWAEYYPPFWPIWAAFPLALGAVEFAVRKIL